MKSTTVRGKSLQLVCSEMTFQIGIVGADGALLASDCQYLFGVGNYGTADQSPPIRHSSMSSKMYWYGGHIACCPSGNDYSDIAAQQCCSIQSPDIGTEELLRDACHSALVTAERHYQDPTYLQGSLLLARRHDGTSELWAADIQSMAPEGFIDPRHPRRVTGHVWSETEPILPSFFWNGIYRATHASPLLQNWRG
jgi:hypothetical protein